MKRLSILLAVGCAAAPAPPPAPAPVPVHVEIAAATAVDRVESAVGVVSAVDAVDVRAETAGLVAEVRFTDGQSVRKGDLLVRLRDGDAQAALSDATARARLAHLTLDRAHALLARQEVAQLEVDRAEADAQLADAALQKAREGLRRTTILAPFDGVLARRDVSVGQTVDPSRVLTRIADLTHLAVDVALPEAALARIHGDEAALVAVDVLNADPLLAHVRYIAPTVSETTRTVDVRVHFDAPDPRLRPGMSASVRIVTEHVPDALAVPTQALVESATGAFLWVVEAEDVVARRPVQTGARTDDRVEITEGLAPGDRVVTEGLSRMKPGAKVRVAEGSGTPR